MKTVFLLVLLINSLVAKVECKVSSSIINYIEKKYKNNISSLVQKNGIFSNDYWCEENIITKNKILVIPYSTKEIEEGVFDLSIIIVSIENNIVSTSKFIRNIAFSDNGALITKIAVSIDKYRAISDNLIISITIESNGNSSVNFFKEKKLYLYEEYNNTFRNLINNFLLEKITGVENGKMEILKISKLFFDKKRHYPYPPIIFYFKTTLKNKNNIIKKTLSYNQGKYYNSDIKIDMNFMKKIESNIKTKKYLYDRGFFEEYLVQVPIIKKTLTTYNNIAYYLQKANANKEAVYLLEKIIEKFPKRTVAYYNLGDAYWALGEKKKAVASYKTYIEQMKAKGKAKRIPKVVKERASFK